MRNARPWQRPCLLLQRQHQRRIVARAAAEIDLQREAALIAFDVGEPDFGEVKAGVPHQRAVGVDPEVVAALVVAEQRQPRCLDHFVRQPPAGRQAGGPGALLPHRKHLRRQPQQRLLRLRHPVAKLGQMNECVRGHVRHAPFAGAIDRPQCAIVGRTAPIQDERMRATCMYFTVMARPEFLGCNELSIGRPQKQQEREAPSVNYEHISCDLDGPLMIVTLNRPDKLNAYTGQMGAEITDAFQRADSDDNVRAVIVTGAGRAFCAGADVSGGAASFDTSGKHGAGVFASAEARRRPLCRGDLQLPKALDRGDQRTRGRRRHHHDLADGCPDRGQGRQDRLHLCPPRPGPGSRQRLVPAEAGRPAAGVALVPLRADVRRR